MTAEPPQFSWGLLFSWLTSRDGVFGLLCGLGVWVLSVGALGFAMQANLAASAQRRAHDCGGMELLIRHLHVRAVAWSVGFTLLQLGSFLVFAFVLRACYRLRAAICFSVGAGFVMLGDALGLLGLLVRVGMTQNVS